MAKMPMPPMADDGDGDEMGGAPPMAAPAGPPEPPEAEAMPPMPHGNSGHHRGASKHRAPLHGGRHPGHMPSGQDTHHALNDGLDGEGG